MESAEKEPGGVKFSADPEFLGHGGCPEMSRKRAKWEPAGAESRDGGWTQKMRLFTLMPNGAVSGLYFSICDREAFARTLPNFPGQGFESEGLEMVPSARQK